MEYTNATSYKHDLQNELMCIEYPGKVKDPENMVKTLGGILNISMVLTSEKRRMELKFRHEDIYAKSAYGDKYDTTGMLLKIKVRKPKNKNKEAIVHSIEIMGKVKAIYKFTNMCDYQMLPVAQRNDNGGKVECIYKDLIPDGILKPEWLQEGRTVPYFLPPFSFSRMDTVQTNLFKKESPLEKFYGTEYLGKTRSRRSKHGLYIAFNYDKEIPTEPNPLAHEMLNAKMISNDTKEKMRKAFESRPVWTKAALRFELEVDSNHIKYILPTLAYYFTTGPWRITWVKFGYDPRKSFEARHYQILDFRVRQIAGMQSQVKAKRNYNLAKPSATKVYKKVFKRGQEEEPKKADESFCTRFEIDTFPIMRITFYQYCDVHVPKIQQMLDKIPTPMTGVVCNEKTGWLPPGFDDQCRNILTEIVITNFRNASESLASDGRQTETDDNSDSEVVEEDELSEGEEEEEVEEEDYSD